MTPGVIYRHRRMLDVDMAIRSVQFKYPDGRLKLTVEWVCRRNGISYGRDVVLVQKRHIAEWTRVGVA